MHERDEVLSAKRAFTVEQAMQYWLQDREGEVRQHFPGLQADILVHCWSAACRQSR